MSLLTKAERRHMKEVLDEEQKERFERAGRVWQGRICEVSVATMFGDTEFLMQSWANGQCSNEIVIDHIDNNPSNNPKDGHNCEWLCRCHNVRKNPPNHTDRSSKFFISNNIKHVIGTGVGVGVVGCAEKDRRSVRGVRKLRTIKGSSAFIADDDLRVGNVEMYKNLMLQDLFETVVRRIMKRVREAQWSMLIEAAVQETKRISPNGLKLKIGLRTAGDWLRPLTADLAPTAPFVVEKKDGQKIVRWRKEILKKKENTDNSSEVENGKKE